MGNKKFVLSIILCLALLSIMAIFSISLGAKNIAFSKVVDVLLGNDPDSLRLLSYYKEFREPYLAYLREEPLAYQGLLCRV